MWTVTPRLAAQSSKPPSAETALQLFEAAATRIKSYDVYLKDTMTFLAFEERSPPTENAPSTVVHRRPFRKGEAPPPRVEWFRQYSQAGRVRIDKINPADGNVVQSIVSDGETEKTLDSPKRSATIRSASPAWYSHGVDYRCSYLHYMGTQPLLGCLRGRSNTRCWMADGLCHLESEGRVGEGGILPHANIHVAFDPSNGFLPVLMEEFVSGDRRRLTKWQTTITDFTDVNGIRVPVRSKTRIFDHADKGMLGEVLAEEVDEIDVSRSRWNLDVPDARFQLVIPAGVKLIDTTRNVRLITGQTDPGKNMDALIANAKSVIRFEPVASTERQSSRWTWTWAAVAVSVGVVFFLVRYWRR